MRLERLHIAVLAVAFCVPQGVWAADLRLGIVGTDTSHVLTFTEALHDTSSAQHVPGARVVVAFKGGSPDLPDSATRVEGLAKELQTRFGVTIVDSLAELLTQVDGVLLTSVDGRVHLSQVREIVAAGKPLFIDKPLASTVKDAREIARVAKQAGVPWFSTSTLRYSVIGMRSPFLSGVYVWGPGPLDSRHQLEMSWYGIHTVEMLYTLMGRGCEEVTTSSSTYADVVSCRWKDGRVGSLRVLRPYSAFGAVVFRKESPDKQVAEVSPLDYSAAPLMRDVVTFFRTGVPPVPNDETLEMFEFMEASQRSKEAGGKPIRLR